MFAWKSRHLNAGLGRVDGCVSGFDAFPLEWINHNDGLSIDNGQCRGSRVGVVVEDVVMSGEDAGAKQSSRVFKKCWWRG